MPYIEPQIDSDTKSMSRRDFLKLGLVAGAAGGAIAAKYKLAKDLENESYLGSLGISSESEEEILKKTPETIEELVSSELSSERLTLIQDLAKFRGECGLSTDIEKIKTIITDHIPYEKWEESPSFEFENKLPEEMQNRGEYLNNVIQTTLGENGTKLIRSIRKTNSEGLMAFDVGAARQVLIQKGYDPSTSGSFLNLAMHEGIGHGTDPLAITTQLIYPKDTYLKVQRAKYMMLSRAYDIEGAFFNNPGDGALPAAQEEIGRFVFDKFEESSRQSSFGINSYLGDEAHSAFLTSLKEVGNVQGRSLQDLEFDYEACRILGKNLINVQRSNGNQLKGELSDVYQDSMEWAYKEIFAEMVKYAIVNPDHFDSDETIMQGAQEVLSAIREDNVGIDSIREEVMQIGMRA